MSAPFWLSHHYPEEHDRCFAVGSLRVCARCLGTYPVLLLALVVQVVIKAPLEYALDLPLVLAGTIPALVDWAYGRFRPHAGTNLWRLFTGVLLGMALGRSLFIHFQRPYPPSLLAQAGLVTAVALPVILVTYRRPRAGVDRPGDSDVSRPR